MTPYRRRVALAASIVALAVPLTGCGAGVNAETSKITAPADGVEASAGGVKLLDTLIVVPAATSAPSGTIDGQLMVTIANSGNQNDRLLQFSAAGAQLGSSPAVDLPAGGVIRIGPDAGQRAVTVRGIRGAAGGSLAMTFTFQSGGVVTLRVPLVAATGYYASVTPPAATSSPTAG